MRKCILYIWILLCVSYACQDDSSTLGSGLVSSSFRNIITDTCTVDMSTLYVDSLETLADTTCQLGHYKDTDWGEVMSSYYAEYSVATFSPASDNTYKFDSITLTLIPSGHYWGDTLTRQHIYVHPIKYPISLPDNEKLYNRSKLEIIETPLTDFFFSPRPGSKKDVEVRLPDEFGMRFFNDLLEEKEAFDNQDKFKTYFPGLAFLPDNTDQCITGFQINKSSMHLTLYYQEVGNQKEEREVTFTVNTDYAYTRVDHDRSGTPLEALKSGNVNAISSTKLNNLAYLQGLTGIYSQIEFPYLNNLMLLGDITSIESAFLYLYPLKGSHTNSQLPLELRLYIADENNVLEDQVYENSGQTIQSGNLSVDSIYNRDTYYSFNITSFLRNNLGAMGMNRKKLLLNLTDDDFTSTFNQVIFTNNKEEEQQVKLSVRFKVYTKE